MEKKITLVNGTTGESTTMTVEELIDCKKSVLESKIKEYNDSEKSGADFVTLKAESEKLDEFVRNEQIKTFIEQYHTLPREEFIPEFLNNRKYTGYRVTQNPKTGDLSLKEAPRAVTLDALEKALNKRDKNSVTPATNYEIAANAKFWKHLPMFYDNILRFIASDIRTSAPKLTAENAIRDFKTRDAEGFPVATSLNKLSQQLNTLVKEFLPESLSIPMNSQDVRALVMAMTKARMMEFSMANQNALVENILFAMEIRLNGRKYAFVAKDKNYKTKD